MPRNRPVPPLKFTKDPLKEEIFRTYDIRGVVGNGLDPLTATSIGLTLAEIIRSKGGRNVVVGRDGRLSSNALSIGLMEGLQYGGLDVMDLGMCPTPLISFSAHYLNHGNGVMVTGSHNPPRYNGFKIMVRGETLHGKQIHSIYENHKAGRYSILPRKGRVRKRMDQVYMSRVTRQIKLARPLKIVVDCGHGVAAMLAPILYRHMGCEVVDLFCRVDGHFPHHYPDPSKPENLQHLIQAVRENNAELGLAYDGDGDRLGVVTREGEIIFPDRLLLLYAADLLMKKPGSSVIYDVKCSGLLAPYIKKLGGKPVMWKTGHALIKSKLKETGAQLAGEMSGHFFFPDRWYVFDDALYAGARLLEIVSRWKDASWPLRNLPTTVSTPEITVAMEEGAPQNLVEELQKRTVAFKGASQIITLDGLRVEYPFGFGLVRASNTTPSLVLRFEADTKEHLHILQETFKKILRERRPNLALSF